MMAKELPPEINQQLDERIERAKAEEYVSPEEIKKMEKFKVKLKKELRKAVVDGEITDEEWEQIYTNISESAVESLLLRDAASLKEFVTENWLSFHEFHEVIRKITDKEYSLDYFFEHIAPQIPTTQFVWMLLRLSQANMLDERVFLHAERIGKSYWLENLLKSLAYRLGPDVFFRHWDDIKGAPWAREAIEEASKHMLPDEIRSNAAYLDSHLQAEYLERADELERARKGESMSDQDLNLLAQRLIENYPEVGKFWRDTWRTMTPDDISSVVSLAASEGVYFDYDFENIKKYKEGAACKSVMMRLAEAGELEYLDKAWQEIATLPWAKEILKQLTDSKLSSEIRAEAKKLDSGPLKKALFKEAARKERQEKPFRSLLRRQLEKQKGDKKGLDDLVREVMQDPALKNLGRVHQEWVKDLAIEAKNLGVRRLKVARIWGGNKSLKRGIDEFPYQDYLSNAQAIVARNLFFQNKPVNEQTVRGEVQRLIEIRKQYRDVPIFEGRNVVILSHNEKRKEDKFNDLNRFGKKAFEEKIKKDGARLEGVIRAEENVASLKQKKQEVLNKIKSTEPPFTFIFDGHGGPEALFLSDYFEVPEEENKDLDAAIKITVEDFFEAYRERQKSHPNSQDPSQKDIFILSSCYNATFIRHFYELCDAKRVSKPIFTGESEYAQLGYSETDLGYGDDFFELMFDYNYAPKATLGNIIDNDAWNLNSNPSIYIPDEKNRTMQLAENESRNRQVESSDSFA